MANKSSMPAMVWMPSAYCQCAIQLLSRNHGSEFVGQGNPSERYRLVGAVQRGRAPSICGSNREEQLLGAVVLERADRPRYLTGRELLAPAVREYKGWSRP